MPKARCVATGWTPSTGSVIALLLAGVIAVGCSSKSEPTRPPQPKSTCLRVPADYPTIQAAINAAADRDTVLIAKGRYRGEGNTNLDPLGKAILITGTDDADSTIIDCRLEGGGRTNGFFLRRGEANGTAIMKLTIMGGKGGTGATGGALTCQNASPRIWNCVIRENEGCAIYLSQSSANFFDCRIEGNRMGEDAVAVWCWESAPRFQVCRISSNMGWLEPAVLCEKGRIVFDGCVLEHNVNVHGQGGALRLEASTARVQGTTIARNICAERSGGAVLLNSGSSLLLLGCTLAENGAGDSGGAIRAEGFTIVRVDQSILWGNCAGGHSEIDAYTASSVTIASSAVDTSLVGGGGQFVYQGQLVTADPMFCRAAGCRSADESDYHLQPGSPCAGEGQMPAMGAWEVALRGCSATTMRGERASRPPTMSRRSGASSHTTTTTGATIGRRPRGGPPWSSCQTRQPAVLQTLGRSLHMV
jgi:predicted outer membrane repeat protein